MSRLAYVTGPATKWRTHQGAVHRDLHALGFDVYRPDLAFVPGPRSAVIARANEAVMRTSRAGVVFLPSDAPTLHHPVAVGQLLGLDIPTVIVVDKKGDLQLKVWESLGAVVCTPDEIEDAMLRLAHLVAERENSKKTLGGAVRELAEKMRELIPAPTPLVFEAVEAESVDTPGGPQHLLPSRGYSDDAGVDLYVSRDFEIGPYDFGDVPCGVKIDIPHGYWGMITGRSSTLRRRGLLVNTGVIDAGWTGELFAGVQNLTGTTARVEAGDRLAQLILLPAPVVGREPEWGRVPQKARGTNGFGSTGS